MAKVGEAVDVSDEPRSALAELILAAEAASEEAAREQAADPEAHWAAGRLQAMVRGRQVRRRHRVVTASMVSLSLTLPGFATAQSVAAAVLPNGRKSTSNLPLLGCLDLL